MFTFFQLLSEMSVSFCCTQLNVCCLVLGTVGLSELFFFFFFAEDSCLLHLQTMLMKAVGLNKSSKVTAVKIKTVNRKDTIKKKIVE